MKQVLQGISPETFQRQNYDFLHSNSLTFHDGKNQKNPGGQSQGHILPESEKRWPSNTIRSVSMSITTR